MDTIKDMIAVVLGGCLVVRGKDRTFAKAPLWLTVLAGLSCPQLVLVTALLIVAFGMRVNIDKA